MEQTNPPDSPRIQGDRRSRSPTRPAHLLERSFSGGQVNLARAGRNVSPGPQLHEAPPLGGLYPWESGGSLEFHLDVAPQPIASFYYSPFDPTMFDTIQFNDSSTDPANAGFQAWTWSFGDGSTGSGCCVTHRYPADGDYTVKLTVTTIDGRTASTTQTVLVKTHDVAITKFTAPQSASAGQTRQIVVGLNSKSYAETVRVEFYKSVPGGYTYSGYQDQNVPVRSANRTTNFQWSYTFTKDDATIGKVTFRALVTILGARDALPADNEQIAPPTKVSKK